MNFILKQSVAICTLVFVMYNAFAGEPMDADLKAALYDIERAEKQAQGLTARKKSHIKRIDRMLETAESRLTKSKMKGQPIWQGAEQRLKKLQAQISDLKNPVVTKSANQYQAPVTQATVTTPASQSGLSQYDIAILDTVNRQTNNLLARVSKVDPLDFSLEKTADRWRGEVARMKQAYLKISQTQHRDALPVAQNINELSALVEQNIQQALQAEAALGDVTIRFAEIESRSRVAIPHGPGKPYTAESVKLFTQQLNALKAVAAEDHAYLQSIKGKTKKLLESQIDTQLAATGEYRQQSIQSVADNFSNQLAQQFNTPDFYATSVANTKPQHFDRNMSALYDAVALLDIVDQFQNEMNMSVVDTTEKHRSYAKALSQLTTRTEEVIQDTRFPKIRSTDSNLLAAAKEVLERPEYTVNPIVHMGITYDKQRKNTAEGRIDWGAAVTTIEVSGYEWDEFAVTTAEQVGDQYFLYYNLFKYFHAGGTDVPTGKWTLGERRKSSRILKENIS